VWWAVAFNVLAVTQCRVVTLIATGETGIVDWWALAWPFDV